MNDLPEVDLLEIERYELAEDPLYHFTFDRRQFLKAFSAGIALLVPMSHLLAQEEQGFDREAPQNVGAWIHIDQDGSIVVYTGKVEFGQNIRTSLAQAVAEELHVPVATIRLVMGDTDLTPFDLGIRAGCGRFVSHTETKRPQVRIRPLGALNRTPTARR